MREVTDTVRQLQNFPSIVVWTVFNEAEGEFGYRKYHSREELTSAIESLWHRDLVPNVGEGLSAIAYTEVCDVEDETNGLFTYDRDVLKVDGDAIRKINQELLEAFREVV